MSEDGLWTTQSNETWERDLRFAASYVTLARLRPTAHLCCVFLILVAVHPRGFSSKWETARSVCRRLVLLPMRWKSALNLPIVNTFSYIVQFSQAYKLLTSLHKNWQPTFKVSRYSFFCCWKRFTISDKFSLQAAVSVLHRSRSCLKNGGH